MAIDLHLEPDDSATPLTAEEQRDLKPSHIAFKHELNEAEQENILRAQAWALKRSTRVDILTEDFIVELHRRMLKEVWKWAGKFRRTERNIGIDWWLIPTQLRTLLDDVNAWIRYGAYPAEEIAVRFHHRLVAIHPFPNGNGRHARLIADMLIMRNGRATLHMGQRQSARYGGNTEALHRGAQGCGCARYRPLAGLRAIVERTDSLPGGLALALNRPERYTDYCWVSVAVSLSFLLPPPKSLCQKPRFFFCSGSGVTASSPGVGGAVCGCDC